MRTVNGLQNEIIALKKEKGFCILAHSYVGREICEIADFVGDSFALSLKAQTVKEQNVIMCGVRFMAETVKILSPEKHVYLANPDAGCPMAEQMSREMIQRVKDEYPGYTVVAYVNTTASLKAISDVCVTSSSAVKICAAIENKNILFIPDCNLGSYVASRLPDKNIKLLDGGCPVHSAITVEEAESAKRAHPDALLLVHPECRPEVSAMADYVGSTSGIMDFAKRSESREFIVGTENSIAETLMYECPGKKFHYLSKRFICPDMKLVTLPDVLSVLKGEGEELILDPDIMRAARRPIDEMIRNG